MGDQPSLNQTSVSRWCNPWAESELEAV
uniref:Uncharacterized protein n=1 Tax=Anguilla anguilla TaxID=7936 RepID=A0A0E9VBH5_ANGAN